MLRIGVDVGGTNTDAALLDGNRVVATVKRPTASNIVDGVIEAIRAVIADVGCTPADVSTLMVGTTQFLNALIKRRGLEKTAVLRLCGPTTRSLPPMVDWPEDLKDAVAAGYLLTDGSVKYDGTQLTPLDPQATRAQAKAWQAAGGRAGGGCQRGLCPRQERYGAGGRGDPARRNAVSQHQPFPQDRP